MEKQKRYPKDLYYSCYSTRVYEHLRQNGFAAVASFCNIKTGRYCHVFDLTPETSRCIAEVSKSRE